MGSPYPRIVEGALIVETHRVIIEIRTMVGRVLLNEEWSRLDKWVEQRLQFMQTAGLPMPPAPLELTWPAVVNDLRIRYREDEEALSAIAAFIHSYFQATDKLTLRQGHPRLVQMSRGLGFMKLAADWSPRGVLFEANNPDQPLTFLLRQREEIDITVGGRRFRIGDIAVVRYEHNPARPVDLAELVTWLDRGMDFVQEWADAERVQSRDSDSSVLTRRRVVAVVLEATLDQATCRRIVAEVERTGMMRGGDPEADLAFVIWREVRDGKTVTRYMGVGPANPRYSNLTEAEIVASLTPWPDDFVEEAFQEELASIAFIGGGPCQWTRQNVLPLRTQGLALVGMGRKSPTTVGSPAGSGR